MNIVKIKPSGDAKMSADFSEISLPAAVCVCVCHIPSSKRQQDAADYVRVRLGGEGREVCPSP